MKPSRVLPSEAKTSVSAPGLRCLRSKAAARSSAVAQHPGDRGAGRRPAAKEYDKQAEEDPSTGMGALIGAASYALNDSRANERF